MTYQHYISHNRSLNSGIPYWKLSSAILSILLLNTIGVAYYFDSELLILLNLTISLVFLLFIFSYLHKSQKVPLIDISNRTLNYFDTESEKIVKVSAHDITHISTKFCELRVHTNERIHIVNLKVVRNEKKRWEIKEKIRTLLIC
ncbi:MAG: hypothetical protein WC220_07010 [Pedobacter sp.]|jgi:hypothetical protein